MSRVCAGIQMKEIYVAALVLLLAVLVTACGDNSIDTRVDSDSSDPSASVPSAIGPSALGPPASGPGGVTFPVELTPARVASGAQVYSDNCAVCHGPVNGPVVLDSAPVHGDAGHTWHHPDRLLFNWILDRPPLAAVMPAFRGVLSDEQAVNVLAYIKSHWLPEIQERQNEGSSQYEIQAIEFGVK